MSDLEFDFKFIPNRYEDRVQRSAVLYPLTKKCLNGHQVRTQVGVMQRMWRARVGALTGCGWEPRPSRGSIGFARNCLPTFLYAEPRTRPCNCATICPFCYARWVREVWLTVDAAFPNPRELNSDPVNDGDIFEYPDTDQGLPQNGIIDDGLRPIMLKSDEPSVRQVFKHHAVEFIYQYTREYPPGQANQAQFLHTLLSELVMIRSRTVKRLGPKAAFMYDTVEPAEDGWRVRTRHLLMIRPDQELPSTYGAQTGARMTRHERPSRKVLFGAVSRVCRYPKLLIHGDPVRTAFLLEARQQQRYRMSAMYRGFRSRTDY